MRISVIFLCLATIVAGCATPPGRSCPVGMNAMLRESLYFGTASPNGPVTPDQWAAFLAETVTPRFPQGLTVLPASGQWRSNAGDIEREDSYVLSIVHAGTAIEDLLFGEIVATYRDQFQQEAVLRVRSEVCVSFEN